MSPELAIQLDWFFKLLITSAVGVIGFFLNRTLNRIEGKLDAYSAIQSQHETSINVFENRLERLEMDIRDVREQIKDCRRECSEGILK